MSQQQIEDVTALGESLSELTKALATRGFKAHTYRVEVFSVEEPRRRYLVRLVPHSTEPNRWEQQYLEIDENGLPL